jgi:hypothetical protein
MSAKKSSPSPRRQDVNSAPRSPDVSPRDSDLVVYDGRVAVGFVREFTGIFVAYGDGGKLIGRFASQGEALRAIPAERRQP